MPAREWNFDGLVGPTHNFAGLSPGNMASTKNADRVSHPKAAALQGLAKMRRLFDLGVPQAVLPPHPRPNFLFLRSVGFTGSDADVIRAAAKAEPKLLAAAYSSSFMWTANATTVSPSADTADGRVHFTPANLITQTHRSIEAGYTAKLLRAVFGTPGSGPSEYVRTGLQGRFVHHDPLPATSHFADEGAANHLRLCGEHGEAGVEVFVDGRGESLSTKYPARQGPGAAAAIARLHGLADDGVMVIRQSPAAIDAGAFHNDVVAASNRSVLLVHPQAWVDQIAVINRLRALFVDRTDGDVLRVFQPTGDEVSLADAVSTYLFNSQIVDRPDGKMAVIAPVECEDHAGVRRFLDRVIAARCGVDSIEFVDLRQSMSNGGGPACLRLRVVLTDAEAAGVHRGVVFDERLHQSLVDVVERKYRDKLRPADLGDPEFAVEAMNAVTKIYRVMGLPDLF